MCEFALIREQGRIEGKPVFLSVFPGHTDLELERDNMVFGRRQEDSDIAVQYSVNYGSKVSVLEI